MTTYDSMLLWCRKTKVAKGNLFWLKKGSLRIDLTAELHFTMGPFFSEIAFEVPFFWIKYWFVWKSENLSHGQSVQFGRVTLANSSDEETDI